MTGWDWAIFAVVVLAAIAWGIWSDRQFARWARKLGSYRPSDTTQAEPTVTAAPTTQVGFGWYCRTCGTKPAWFATYEAREADACAHWISEHEGEM